MLPVSQFSRSASVISVRKMELWQMQQFSMARIHKSLQEQVMDVLMPSAMRLRIILMSAMSLGAVDKVVKEQGLEIPDKTYDVLDSLFGTLETAVPYTTKAFEHGTEARKVLEYNLADKAAEDRAAVQELIAQGQTLEEACASYISEESFQNWYNDFVAALQNTMNKAE